MNTDLLRYNIGRNKLRYGMYYITHLLQPLIHISLVTSKLISERV